MIYLLISGVGLEDVPKSGTYRSLKLKVSNLLAKSDGND